MRAMTLRPVTMYSLLTWAVTLASSHQLVPEGGSVSRGGSGHGPVILADMSTTHCWTQAVSELRQSCSSALKQNQERRRSFALDITLCHFRESGRAENLETCDRSDPVACTSTMTPDEFGIYTQFLQLVDQKCGEYERILRDERSAEASETLRKLSEETRETISMVETKTQQISEAQDRIQTIQSSTEETLETLRQEEEERALETQRRHEYLISISSDVRQQVEETATLQEDMALQQNEIVAAQKVFYHEISQDMDQVMDSTGSVLNTVKDTLHNIRHLDLVQKAMKGSVDEVRETQKQTKEMAHQSLQNQGQLLQGQQDLADSQAKMKETTSELLEGLSARSEVLHSKMDQSLGNEDELLRKQSEAQQNLEAFRRQQEEATQLLSQSLDEVHGQTIDVVGKLEEGREHFEFIQATLDNILNLNFDMWIEIRDIKALVFYIPFIVIGLFATSFTRLSSSRMWIVFLAFFNFYFVEKTIASYINLAKGNHVALASLVWMSRAGLSCIALLHLLWKGLTYKDYNVENYTMLQKLFTTTEDLRRDMIRHTISTSTRDGESKRLQRSNTWHGEMTTDSLTKPLISFPLAMPPLTPSKLTYRDQPLETIADAEASYLSEEESTLVEEFKPGAQYNESEDEDFRPNDPQEAHSGSYSDSDADEVENVSDTGSQLTHVAVTQQRRPRQRTRADISEPVESFINTISASSRETMRRRSARLAAKIA